MFSADGKTLIGRARPHTHKVPEFNLAWHDSRAKT